VRLDFAGQSPRFSALTSPRPFRDVRGEREQPTDILGDHPFPFVITPGNTIRGELLGDFQTYATLARGPLRIWLRKPAGISTSHTSPRPRVSHFHVRSDAQTEPKRALRLRSSQHV
jgi:hypothetical protein